MKYRICIERGKEAECIPCDSQRAAILEIEEAFFRGDVEQITVKVEKDKPLERRAVRGCYRRVIPPPPHRPDRLPEFSNRDKSDLSCLLCVLPLAMGDYLCRSAGEVFLVRENGEDIELLPECFPSLGEGMAAYPDDIMRRTDD